MDWRIKASGIIFAFFFFTLCTQQDEKVKLHLSIEEENLYNINLNTLMAYESIENKAGDIELELLLNQMDVYDIDLELLVSQKTSISLQKPI